MLAALLWAVNHSFLKRHKEKISTKIAGTLSPDNSNSNEARVETAEAGSARAAILNKHSTSLLLSKQVISSSSHVSYQLTMWVKWLQTKEIKAGVNVFLGLTTTQGFYQTRVLCSSRCLYHRQSLVRAEAAVSGKQWQHWKPIGQMWFLGLVRSQH